MNGLWRSGEPAPPIPRCPRHPNARVHRLNIEVGLDFDVPSYMEGMVECEECTREFANPIHWSADEIG